MRTAELRQLFSRVFLHRLRLNLDMDEAATAKVKRDNCDKEGPIPNLAELVEEAKENFVAKARGYLVFLLENFLGHISLKTDIVREMASLIPAFTWAYR